MFVVSLSVCRFIEHLPLHRVCVFVVSLRIYRFILCVCVSSSFRRDQAIETERAKKKKIRRKSRGRSKPTGVEGQKQVNFDKAARAKLAEKAKAVKQTAGGASASAAHDDDGVPVKSALARFQTPK